MLDTIMIILLLVFPSVGELSGKSMRLGKGCPGSSGEGDSAASFLKSWAMAEEAGWD